MIISFPLTSHIPCKDFLLLDLKLAPLSCTFPFKDVRGAQHSPAGNSQYKPENTASLELYPDPVPTRNTTRTG
jgi:hypothetical protein